MDKGMYELVEMILRCVAFISIGGGLALIFFFIFAPNILGSKVVYKQLDKLLEQTQRMNEQLGKVIKCLEEKPTKAKDNLAKEE